MDFTNEEIVPVWSESHMTVNLITTGDMNDNSTGVRAVPNIDKANWLVSYYIYVNPTHSITTMVAVYGTIFFSIPPSSE